jgi:hypothetical protein
MAKVNLVALFAFALVVCPSAPLFATNNSQQIKVSYSDVIPTGFGSAYPITFVYNQQGSIVNIFGPNENKSLVGFLSRTNETYNKSADKHVIKQAATFKALLKHNGVRLNKEISHSTTLTAFTFQSDSSVGNCPPCKRRGDLITKARLHGASVTNRIVAFVLY